MHSADFAQRAVLGHLLGSHPAMLGLDELAAALTDAKGVERAVSQLVDDGLVTLLGEPVGLTRTTLRMAELDPS